jgi:hypothetical protein
VERYARQDTTSAPQPITGTSASAKSVGYRHMPFVQQLEDSG